MWTFDGVITSACDNCGDIQNNNVSDFSIECYGGDYKENGMGAQNNYQLLFEFNCPRCHSEITLDFDATEYPIDFLSYVINNSNGASCSNEPYITHLDDEAIYTFPEPEIIVPESRIITDINLIRANIPDLIRFLSQNPQHIHSLTPREFEEIIAEIFRAKGFEVTLTAKTRDGGKDIIAIHRNDLGIDTKYFIECKRYAPENKVGVEIVRALHGVKNTVGAPNKVILATTSSFTSGAVDFVQNQAPSTWDISLKDYNDILQWMRLY
ncbi:restriction endonuclease [Desulfosediminicola ganghwensis]|uniref:restriction endonuclease n=1 Tax=Desulfosediminicola ganghwensis TaxID=2569540 RepID=UPI0010ACF442|nr:restriction endonuclease [Desulfosediminicola ganghwensis]